MRCATLLVSSLVLATPAYADSLSANWLISNSGGLNFEYQASVAQSGANHLVTFTVQNTGTVDGYVRGFGIKGMFDGALSSVGSDWFTAALLSSGGATTPLTVFTGAVNQKTNQSDYCTTNGGGHDGALCAELQVSNTNRLVAAGQSLVFTFLVTGADPVLNFSCTSDCGWHLQTKVFSASSGNGALGSISAGAVPVPEPATLLLLGIGTTTAALASRKRRQTNRSTTV